MYRKIPDCRGANFDQSGVTGMDQSCHSEMGKRVNNKLEVEKKARLNYPSCGNG